MKLNMRTAACSLLIFIMLITSCAAPPATSQNSADNSPEATGTAPSATPSPAQSPSAEPPAASPEKTATSAEAVNMKLRKTYGDVTVKDDNDEDVPAKENIKLYSGYDVGTAKKSYAWIDLDSLKLAKLDAKSDAVINKDGKNLEIEIVQGSLFFDIAKPLEEDESLYIRTSTMAIGIRGTVGWVSVEDENSATVSLLEGNVDVTLEDTETGETAEGSVMPGEAVNFAIGNSAADGGKCQITSGEIKVSDIPGYVLVDVVADSALVQQIYDGTGGALDLRGITEEDAQKILEQDEQDAPTDIQGKLRNEYSQTLVIDGYDVTMYRANGGFDWAFTVEPNGAGYSYYYYWPGDPEYNEEPRYSEDYLELIDPNTLRYALYNLDLESGNRIEEVGESDIYYRID